MELDRPRETWTHLEDIAASIRNIIFSRIPNLSLEERQDVEQDVLLKLWGMISRGKNIKNMRSYLWRVVVTTALDVIGERPPRALMTATDHEADQIPTHRLDEISPERQLEDKEARHLVLQAIAELPSRRRQAVELWLSDMNIEEIARALQWNENQVRHLLYRGIDEVKASLAGRTRGGAIGPKRGRLDPQEDPS